MFNKNILLLAMSILLTIQIPLNAKRLKVGDKAPLFVLSADTGEVIDLNTFSGKKIALCFYPKLNDEGEPSSPFCKLQLKVSGDKAGFSLLREKNIVVFGISTNSADGYKEFKKKYALPIPLLTASKKELKAYGVKGWWGKTMRKTFLIDEQGIIVGIIDNVKLRKHTHQIIKRFVAA